MLKKIKERCGSSLISTLGKCVKRKLFRGLEFLPLGQKYLAYTY